MINTSTTTTNSGPRRRIAAALAAFIAAGTVTLGAGQVHAAAAAYEPHLDVAASSFDISGQRVSLPAAIVAGETYIGVRSLNDQLGIRTVWNSKTHQAELTGRGRTMQLSQSDGYLLNGSKTYASPVYIQSGTTFVPLRFVLQSFGYAIGYDAPTKTVTINPIAENAWSWHSESITYKADKQTLSVSYPVFTGLGNAEAQNKINAKLKADAERYAASGREALKKAAKENADLEKNSPDVKIPPIEYDGQYTITYNEQGKLSLYFDYYVYTGGAHGGIERVPYTFDLDTGNILTLKQAALGNDKYVSIINEAILKQIKQQKLELLVPFKSIEPDRPFYLKHGAIAIYFSQYEYTPYAAGMPEFSIPFGAFR
ncbi:PdaC/SigV domain-containing protein [Cohnella sp. 56]|uniref:PdaC/SigV domain-containing protein n=1 Tax=Cohnella sp. 56 TaxID=3113722 RepID=UPI0030E80BA7